MQIIILMLIVFVPLMIWGCVLMYRERKLHK
jgi:hypothetical protein